MSVEGRRVEVGVVVRLVGDGSLAPEPRAVVVAAREEGRRRGRMHEAADWAVVTCNKRPIQQ